MKGTDTMELWTNRLKLRDFRPEDAEFIHRYASDPEVVEYMEWGPNTWEQTQKFVDAAITTAKDEPRTAFDLVVTFHDGSVIGAVGLYVDLNHRKATLGYCFHKDYWGQGYAFEAAKALTEFGFNELGLHRIEGTCDVLNKASARILTKLGMTYEGCLRQNLHIRGIWRSTYMYAKVRDQA